MRKLKEDDVSIVIPAKNEADNLSQLLPELVSVIPRAEIIIVNDGSHDETGVVAKSHGAKVITHVTSKGNGAAIKSGARAATRKFIIFMDADGQHNPEDIPKLMRKMEQGYDMVVGARDGASQASFGRRAANWMYNKLSSFMVNYNVDDLTSGFRIVEAKKFRQFLFLLPNGFSYPTTITMSFFRIGYAVAYIPIVARSRAGSSHISVVKDGVRFLLIIFKVGTLYSPMKIFFPASSCFLVFGLLYYLYTYISDGRFTNMSTLLFVTSIVVFLIGLVSEQIAMLLYKDVDENIDFDG